MAQTIQFHTGLGIASLLAILARNAKSPDEDFGDFKRQMDETIALGDTLAIKGVAHAAAFKTIAQHVKAFHDTGNNKELFTKAHEAIRDLLVQLPTDEWGPCRHVSHAMLETILSIE
jgi:hypothetical protein